jgi:ABC-type bacteriocin/lantibiotic exporter with double-glycine peptidase domain
MSDAIKLAVITLIGSVVTTIGIIAVAYFQYGAKQAAKQTAEVSRDTNAVVTETKGKVEAVHEQTNGRLMRAEAALADMVAERDKLLADAASRRRDDP